MKHPIHYRMYLPLIGTLCLAACILRTVACLTVRDIHGYFPTSVLPEISAWLLLCGALIALSYPLLHKEPSVRPILFEGSAAIFPAGILALCQVLLCVQLLPALSAKHAALGATASPIVRIIFLLTVVCGLAGAVYYVLCLAIRETESELRAWLGMAAVLFCALYAVYLYFDTALPINATTKITSQVTYLAMAVYLLLDVRMSLGRPRYRLQVAIGLIAAALTAYAAIPALITYIVQGAVIDRSLYETLCTLAFFLFVCSRLYAMARLPEDVHSPYLASVAERAKATATADAAKTADEPTTALAAEATETPEDGQADAATEEEDA